VVRYSSCPSPKRQRGRLPAFPLCRTTPARLPALRGINPSCPSILHELVESVKRVVATGTTSPRHPPRVRIPGPSSNEVTPPDRRGANLVGVLGRGNRRVFLLVPSGARHTDLPMGRRPPKCSTKLRPDDRRARSVRRHDVCGPTAPSWTKASSLPFAERLKYCPGETA